MLEHDERRGGNEPVIGGESGGSAGHVDEGTVHAWLDGQLSSEESTRIETHIRGCAACSALVAEARGYIAASTRILNALDGVPAKVVPAARPKRRAWQMRIAAAIVVMAAGTAVILRGPLGKTSAPSDLRTAAVHNEVPASIDSQSRSFTGPAATANKSGRAPSKANPSPQSPDRKTVERPAPSAGRQAAGQALGLKPPAPARMPIAKTAPAAVGGVAPQDRDRLAFPAPGESLAQAPLVVTAPSAAAAAPAPMPAPIMENALRGRALSFTTPRAVAGHVVDADGGAPVSAASVLVAGTAIGQSTSDSGTFQIAVPADAKSLTVRRIGYLAQNVPLTGGESDYTIPLKRDVLRLESQVVTGVATTTASPNSANAVTVLSSKDITGQAPLAPGVAGGGPSGGLQAKMSSQCPNQVLHLAIPRASGTLEFGDTLMSRDALTARLLKKQSLDSGFVIRLIPDSSPALSATWQPLGTDSAIVTVRRPMGVTVVRVKCE